MLPVWLNCLVGPDERWTRVWARNALRSCSTGIGTAQLSARALNAELLRRGAGAHFGFASAFELDRQGRQVSHEVAPDSPCGGNLLGLRPEAVQNWFTKPFHDFASLRAFLTGMLG